MTIGKMTEVPETINKMIREQKTNSRHRALSARLDADLHHPGPGDVKSQMVLSFRPRLDPTLWLRWGHAEV